MGNYSGDMDHYWWDEPGYVPPKKKENSSDTLSNWLSDPGGGDQAKKDQQGRLNSVGGNAGILADDAHVNYQNLSGRLNGSLDELQARANGQNSVSAIQLHQALQQNLASQRSLAQSGSPGNAGMSARTAAIQMGRLGTGLAGQQALAGQAERNAAQDAYAGMLGQARGQDGQLANSAYGTQVNAYSGGGKQQESKSTMEKYAPYVTAAAMAFSDRRVKTDIEPGDDKANRALGKLSAYSYQYKDQAHGAGPQLGIMAQDLESSGLGHAVIDTPQGKMINGAKLAGANTAMLSALAGRVGELEKKKR